MPELPEVETVCRGLERALGGKILARVEARRPDLRIPLPPGFASRLAHRRIERVVRRAKYILLHLDDGQVVIAHLGMSGRMRIQGAQPEPPGLHDHVILEAEDGTVVYFNDARRFGLMTLVDLAGLDTHPLLAGLGPEPLGNGFNGPALAAALAGRNTPIKAALLDQRVVAGLGNIYVSEALFHAGLSPRRKAATVQGERAERLAAAVKSVLEAAIAAGGSSLRDYVQPDGELGYFQHRWAVYDRAGLACPGCDCVLATTGGIKRIVQSNRSTYYCPRRQR
jgi:formamidopyrimidine-DNA glycosylase